MRIGGDWREGGAWALKDKTGAVVSEGEVRVCDPPRTLELTWRVLAYDPPPAPALIRYDIEALGEVVRLTMTQTDPPNAPPDWAESARWGTQIVLSALKTLLETGATFQTPPPGA